MSICICCSRPISEKQAKQDSRCPRCFVRNCTSQMQNCGVERPKQHPMKHRDTDRKPLEDRGDSL